MTNTNLTLVLSFDEAGNYEPAGHNLKRCHRAHLGRRLAPSPAHNNRP